MKPLLIYKSSAGSGKTYALTKEYLTLALSRDQYYKHILAVTFTNKATRELKERVIKTLYGFSQGVKDGMFDELVQRLFTTEKDLQERSGRLLRDLLNQYSRFSITTIDAFFQKIIRTFARDSGIQGNFKLETDEEAILDEAVRLLIEEASSDSVLSSWLVEFAGNKLEEGKSWDISKEIKELGKELFTERFKEL
ncbi:MAG: UvrD-helicase domain-containing protein, partial [Cyclobacteriaceae bacterium]|nr:UvrD-helicase domain-containing protein [Cyclobacteriaceae bacterium]